MVRPRTPARWRTHACQASASSAGLANLHRHPEDAITVVDSELQNLNRVGPRPQYEFYAERNPRSEPVEGYGLTHDYCYGLKREGNKALEVSWTINYGAVGAS